MNRRGFTLLEVVLALALSLLLLGALVTFLWELSDRRSALARGSRDLHAGAVLMERLEADLTTGLAGDKQLGAGVQGTETSLKILSRGVWLAPEASGNTPESDADLQASEYRFDPSSGQVLAKHSPVSPGGGGGAGALELLSDRVERLRFRYYDGRAWRTSFNSMDSGTLPVAIEVAVWFTSLKNATAPPMVVPTGAGAIRDEQATEPEVDDAARSDSGPAESDPEKRWPAPDRLRVIIIPDGPVTSWKEGV